MYDELEEQRLARVRDILRRACQIGAISPRAGDALVARAANVLEGVVYRQEHKATVIPFPRKP